MKRSDLRQRADKALMVMVLNRDEELKIMAICTGTCWERGAEKSLLLASIWVKFSSPSAVSYRLETPCSKGVPRTTHTCTTGTSRAQSSNN